MSSTRCALERDLNCGEVRYQEKIAKVQGFGWSAAPAFTRPAHAGRNAYTDFRSAASDAPMGWTSWDARSCLAGWCCERRTLARRASNDARVVPFNHQLPSGATQTVRIMLPMHLSCGRSTPARLFNFEHRRTFPW